MILPAHFEESSVSHPAPRGVRRVLRLVAPGRTAQGEAGAVTIHNLSATGLLIECAAALGEGERFAIDLPQAAGTVALVVWASGLFYGCRFETPVSEAVLAAAQLRAGPLPADVVTAESFGLRLQRLRKARGLSMSQLAAILGVSKPTVWAWEQGKARPVEDRLEAIAAALGVTPAEVRPGSDAQGIAELVARCREQIAAASGAAIDRVRILIEL